MIRRTAFAAFAALLAAAVPAQKPSAPAATPPAAAKPPEWPALSDADKLKARGLIDQFRKPDAKLHEPAHKALVALGAGAAPLVMGQVVDRQDGVNAQLFAVLDDLLGRDHGALMARESKKPRVELRRYLARRLCCFGDKDLVATHEALAKDADADTAFYGRLGAFALGRTDHLPGLLDHCRSKWTDVAPVVAQALAPVRSRELAAPVFERIADKDAVEQMNGLRLLRHLMVKEQGMLLHRYLDDGQHTVKREAVNTARCLFGEAPIENLSVFQAIEQAKLWRAKV